MGYRIYLGKMQKTTTNSLNKMNINILLDKKKKDEWYSPMDEVEKDIYEFGKYVEWTDGDFKKYCKKIILDSKVEEYIEGDFYTINKDGLAFIIEYYRKAVFNSYEDMYLTMENTIKGKINTKQKTNEIFDHIRSMTLEWANQPYTLTEDKNESIVSSWKYEYAVFELARIYQIFEYDKYDMVVYGY